MNYLLINSRSYDKRIALLEKGRLSELIIEREDEHSIVGNIYKGRVEKILPGIQTAFVDIGIERNAFLRFSDVRRDYDEAPWTGEEVSLEEPERVPSRERPGRERQKLQHLLREGQEILIQVAKDPMGTKGARITTRCSLPGRYVVLMPNFEKIGISRRIERGHMRDHLRKIVEKVRPSGSGVIVRTVSEEGVGEIELRHDVEYLQRLWRNIMKDFRATKAPSLLHKELDMIVRTVRDLFTSKVHKIVVDSNEEYERIMNFVVDVMPKRRRDLALYKEREPLFDHYGVEQKIHQALERTVRLKSGGSIKIDETEALVAIDVNTGKFVGRSDHEETIVKTNLEAIPEIVSQIRLRNLGGLIVIDFIDMDRGENRERVYNSLKETLKEDKAPSMVLKISELGIVEMSRKRIRDSLWKILCEPCPTCEKRGLILSTRTIIAKLLRELEARATGERKRKASLLVHPDIAKALEAQENIIEGLRKSLKKKIVIKPQEEYTREKYEIIFSYF